MRITTPQHSFLVQPAVIDSIALALCTGLGLSDYELSWDFVDEEAMRELNAEFRNKDRSTDVLSFPQEEWDKPLLFQRPAWPIAPKDSKSEQPPRIVGDIVISPEDALRNAENIGHKLDRETCFLLVHGFLHLCGHDHEQEDEEALMLEQQRQIMDFLEHTADRPLWTDCIRIEA